MAIYFKDTKRSKAQLESLLLQTMLLTNSNCLRDLTESLDICT